MFSCRDNTTVSPQKRIGSKQSFEQVASKYTKDAYFIALGLVGNREDALDLSQEAFFKAYKNIHQLRSKAKFFPWFYQILRNVCFTHLRKKRPCFIDDYQEECGIQIADTELSGPQAKAESNETAKQLWSAIGKLRAKHREVIILRHFRSLSYGRIAEILSCCRGTVMSRLYNARKELRRLLDNKKGGPLL